MLKKELKKIKYILVDTDGTLNYGDEPIFGAAEALAKLRMAGKKIVFLTNDTSHSPSILKEKYRKMGMFEEQDYFYTPVYAAIDLIQNGYQGKKCFIMGNADVVEDFASHGVQIDEDAPEIAVLARDTSATYEKAVKFEKAVKNGAYYITLSQDKTVVGDLPLPDCGTFATFFETAAGISPKANLGKPQKLMGEKIMKHFGCNANEIMVIGDDIPSDIQFGINCGFYTMLVLTGATDEKTAKLSDVVPDFMFKNIIEICDYLED